MFVDIKFCIIIVITFASASAETQEVQIVEKLDESTDNVFVTLTYITEQTTSANADDFISEKSSASDSVTETDNGENTISYTTEALSTSDVLASSYFTEPHVQTTSSYLREALFSDLITVDSTNFGYSESTTLQSQPSDENNFSSTSEASISALSSSSSQIELTTNPFEEDKSTSDCDTSTITTSDSPDYETTKDSEIIALTSQFHDLRVQLVNYTHTIQAQQRQITNLTEIIDDLESDVSKLKTIHEHDLTELQVKSLKCERDFIKVVNELKVAKTLIGIERYSKALRTKLEEFHVLQNSILISNKTVLKFSVFELESDEIAGKILSNRQLLMLPPGIGAFISNVTELSATNVGLLAVNPNAFEGMEKLMILNLSRNEISEIENEAFAVLVKLKILDLSCNKIAQVDVKSFDGLTELEELNLEHNLLTQLPGDVFEDLLNLKVLILSHNKIQEVKNEIFTVINVIEEFYINDNELKWINPKVVSDFETAKIIDFSRNLCINQQFPNDLTMVQLAIEITENCWRNI